MDTFNSRNVLILLIIPLCVYANEDGGKVNITDTSPCNDKPSTASSTSDNESGTRLTTEPILTTDPSSLLRSSFPGLTPNSNYQFMPVSPPSATSVSSPSLTPGSSLLLESVSLPSSTSVNLPLLASFSPSPLTSVSPLLTSNTNPLLTSFSPQSFTSISYLTLLSSSSLLLTSNSSHNLAPDIQPPMPSIIPTRLTSKGLPSMTPRSSPLLSSVSAPLFTTVSSPAFPPEVMLTTPSSEYWNYPDVIINSTDVNMYLEQPDAQDYIASFSQEFQRMIVEATLRYCPYVTLCNFTFGLNPPWSFLDERNPCCYSCSCQTYCVSEGICCPDYRGLPLPPAILSDAVGVKETCMPTVVHPRSLNLSISDDLIEAYQNCPQNTDEILHLRCTERFDLLPNITLDDVIPLSSNVTMTTYRNRHCALCNGVDVVDLTPWRVQLKCLESPSLTQVEELLPGILDETIPCQLEFRRPPSVDVEYCSHVINSCNVTGLWVNFDLVMYRACSVYETLIGVERGFGDIVFFKNPFCAICNGMEPSSDYLCKPGSGDPYTDPFTFSGLLRLDSYSKPEVSQEIICGPGMLFDEVKNRCQNVTCPHHSIFQNGRCEPYLEGSDTIGYRLFTLLRSNTDISIRILYDIMPALRTEFEGMINNIYDGSICSSQAMVVLNNDGVEDDINVTVDFIELTYDIVPIDCDLPIDMNIELLLALDGRNITINDSSGDVILFNVYLKDDTRAYNTRIPYDKFNNWTLFGFPVPLPDLFFLSFMENSRRVIPYFYWGEHPLSCPLKATIVRLLTMRSCPMVTVDLTEFGLIETPFGLKFKARNDTLISLSEYLLGDNHPSIKMCLDTYRRILQTAVTYAKIDMTHSAESIVSLVSVSISIVCLVISLFTYLYLPQLQSLPGRNNMALIVSLLLAQGMYLLGSYGRLELASFACKLVGGLTHFFWLLSISWMNVCTFHMFRVLIRTRAVIRTASTKKYLQYHAYCILLSTAFVSVNVIVTMVTSDFSDYGYGASHCYISTQRMIEVTFGIPAAIVVIANLAMFIVIIIKLTRAPTIKKNTKHDRNYFIVFVKMSTITGATWLFGFVYMWTGITAFSFVFIILNGSQGLFLILSFVCNRKTLVMLKDTWKRRAPSLTTSRSSEAHLTNIQGSRL